jgi:hypothetical protein
MCLEICAAVQTKIERRLKIPVLIRTLFYTDRDPVTPTGEMWLLPSSHWLTVLLLLIGHTAQHQNKGRR